MIPFTWVFKVVVSLTAIKIMSDRDLKSPSSSSIFMDELSNKDNIMYALNQMGVNALRCPVAFSC